MDDDRIRNLLIRLANGDEFSNEERDELGMIAGIVGRELKEREESKRANILDNISQAVLSNNIPEAIKLLNTIKKKQKKYPVRDILKILITNKEIIDFLLANKMVSLKEIIKEQINLSTNKNQVSQTRELLKEWFKIEKNLDEDIILFLSIMNDITIFKEFIVEGLINVNNPDLVTYIVGEGQGGNEDAIKLMIEAKMTPETINVYLIFETICSINPSYDLFKMVIEAKADIDLEFENGVNALFSLCDRDTNYDNVKLLIELKANINLQDESLRTPLFLSDTQIAKLLVESKANLDIQDENGSTILSYSVQNNQDKSKIIYFLNQINVNIPDDRGIFAIDYIVNLSIRNAHKDLDDFIQLFNLFLSKHTQITHLNEIFEFLVDFNIPVESLFNYLSNSFLQQPSQNLIDKYVYKQIPFASFQISIINTVSSLLNYVVSVPMIQTTNIHSELSGSCFDVVLNDDSKVEQYLSEDPNNVVIEVITRNGNRSYYCWNKTYIDSGHKQLDVYLQCQQGGGVYLNSPMVRNTTISGFAIGLYLEVFLYIIWSNYRIYTIEETDLRISRIIGMDTYISDEDQMSAFHCQPDRYIPIYQLVRMDYYDEKQQIPELKDSFYHSIKSIGKTRNDTEVDVENFLSLLFVGLIPKSNYKNGLKQEMMKDYKTKLSIFFRNL